MRFTLVMLFTGVATIARVVLLMSTRSAKVENQPEWLKALGWAALIDSPSIGVVTGLLVWRAIRRSGP